MTTYKRRPEQPDPSDDDPLLGAIVPWILDTAAHRDRLLQVAGIWGPRGSGKTSILLKLLARLKGAAEKRENDFPLVLPRCDDEEPRCAKECQKSVPLKFAPFEPEQLDDSLDDHLLSSFFSYLKDRYTDVDSKHLEKAKTLLVEQAHQSLLLGYVTEVAPSKESALKEAEKFLEPHFRLSGELRTLLKKAFQELVPPGKKYLILCIDDIDLVPHRSYDLLRCLHLYFRNLPLIVFVAGDRPSLLQHVESRLNALHGRNPADLAAHVLAKYVHYDWYIEDFDPRFSSGQALTTILFDDKENHFDVSRWWTAKAERMLRRGWGRVRREPGAHADPTPTWKQAGHFYLSRFAPTTWRGLKRTYNRLAALEERLKLTQETNHEQPARTEFSGGFAPDLLKPLLSVVVAADEAFPELDLYATFCALRWEPDRIQVFLDREIADLTKAWKTRKHPRLLPSSLPWRRILHLRDILKELRDFLEVLKYAGEAFAPALFLAITACPAATDAYESSSPFWRDRLDLPPSNVQHLDCRHLARQGRPNADEVRQIIAHLQQNLPNFDVQTSIFPSALLSILAWVGWYIRYKPAKNLALVHQEGGTGEYSEYLVDAVESRIDREQTSPSITEVVDTKQTEEPSRLGAETHDALVLVDIRREPDGSERAPSFIDKAGNPVPAALAVKLVSNPGFRLTPDNASTVLSDVVWLLRDLRNSGYNRIHLAMACPGVLAFLIGRHLHPFSPVEIYEYYPQELVYRWVTTLG